MNKSSYQWSPEDEEKEVKKAWANDMHKAHAPYGTSEGPKDWFTSNLSNVGDLLAES